MAARWTVQKVSSRWRVLDVGAVAISGFTTLTLAKAVAAKLNAVAPAPALEPTSPTPEPPVFFPPPSPGGVLVPPVIEATVNWTPLNLASATLEAWYDANDAASISLSAGNIAQHSDKSGKNHHLVQGGTVGVPYSATQFPGSKPGIGVTTATGGASLFRDAPTLKLGAISVFVSVARAPGVPADDERIASFPGTDNSDYTASNGHFLIIQPDNANVAFYRLNGFGTEVTTSATISDGPGASVAHVIAATQTATTIAVRVDGSDGGTPKAGTYAATATSTPGIGVLGPGWSGGVTSANTFRGQYNQVIIVSGTGISAADIERLEGFIAWESGLVANLPAGHPYKAARPTTSGTAPVPVAGDTTPDPFSFNAAPSAVASSVQTSNTIKPTGFNAPTTVSVTGGTVSINNGAFGTGGAFNPGDTITARGTASATAGGTVNVVPTIGGVSGTFGITTVQSSALFDGPAELPRSVPVIASLAGMTFANTYTVVSGSFSDLQAKINTAAALAGAGNILINVPVATYTVPQSDGGSLKFPVRSG
nr:hypothetical protein [bacterium]